MWCKNVGIISSFTSALVEIFVHFHFEHSSINYRTTDQRADETIHRNPIGLETQNHSVRWNTGIYNVSDGEHTSSILYRPYRPNNRSSSTRTKVVWQKAFLIGIRQVAAAICNCMF